MTQDTAYLLREKWQAKNNGEECQHFQLEMEWTVNADPTGNYICMMCGVVAAHRVG